MTNQPVTTAPRVYTVRKQRIRPLLIYVDLFMMADLITTYTDHTQDDSMNIINMYILCNFQNPISPRLVHYFFNSDFS